MDPYNLPWHLFSLLSRVSVVKEKWLCYDVSVLKKGHIQYVFQMSKGFLHPWMALQGDLSDLRRLLTLKVLSNPGKIKGNSNISDIRLAGPMRLNSFKSII